MLGSQLRPEAEDLFALSFILLVPLMIITGELSRTSIITLIA